jgi:hypothetical protein
MKEFISDEDVPSYAILSHTWGPDEISYQDWESQAGKDIVHKGGFRKIESFCDQAVKDGWEWGWADT